MAQQFFNLAEVMGQVDLSRAREQQMRGNEFDMKRQQREMERLDKADANDNAFRDLYRNSMTKDANGMPQYDQQAIINGAMAIDPIKGMEIQEKFNSRNSDAAKSKNELAKNDLSIKVEKAKYYRDVLASATPETYASIMQQAQQDGMAFAANAPQQYDPNFIKQNVMTADSFIKQSGGGDEDNLVIPTPDGLMYFNKKNKKDFGYIEQGGKRVMRSQDDAPLRGQVKEAEARATAGYKINDAVDGVVSTDRQVAETSNPQLIRPAQGSQFGEPSFRVQPNVQQQRDVTRLQTLINEREPNVYNAELEKEIARMGGDRQPKMAGIIVPTKAQQAANEATAKDNVTVQSDKNKAVRKSDQLLANVTQAEQLLKLDPTGSGIGAVMDVAGRMVGLSSSSAKVATQLETLSGWMVANVPRMEGPQSNFDVQNYQTMAAKIGDRTTPVGERKAALKTMKELQLKYKALNSNESNSSPLTLTLPNGKTATFKDKAMMDAYKKYKGIK